MLDRATPFDAIRPILQAIEDAGGGDVVVRNYVVLWDGELGFVQNIQPNQAEAFARRLRDMAAAVEGMMIAEEPNGPTPAA